MRILMVCMGNICRSPLAEGIFRREAHAAGLDWEVDSAGTIGWHAGSPPDPRSIAVAHAHGLDITEQRARHLQAEDLQRFDYVFAMDSHNLDHVQNLAARGRTHARVHLFLDYAGLDAGSEVPDPYTDDAGFPIVYRMIESACESVISRILRETESFSPLLVDDARRRSFH